MVRGCKEGWLPDIERYLKIGAARLAELRLYFYLVGPIQAEAPVTSGEPRALLTCISPRFSNSHAFPCKFKLNLLLSTPYLL